MSEATEVGSAPSSAPNSAQGSDATGDVCCTGDSHGYITAKGDYLARLRRIEGQARGLQRMVDEDKYCIDILTQVSAMTKGLQAVAMGPARGPHRPLRRQSRCCRWARGGRENQRSERGDCAIGPLIEL